MDSDDDSKEEIIDDLTVALHLDAIQYDPKSKQYKITLSGVQLTYLDIENDTLSLNVPLDRLQRIKTPTYNAEIYTAKATKSVDSDLSHHSHNEADIDEITGIILNENGHHFNDDVDDKRQKQKQKQQNSQIIALKKLKRQNVITEWAQICKKYKGILSEQPIITKNGCLTRITFLMKHYSQWICYKDKHFKSQQLPKVVV